MSGFYEVTMDPDAAAGDESTRRHRMGRLLRSIPPPTGPSRGRRTPPPRRLFHSPYGLATKVTGLLHSQSQQAQRNYTAVAQTPGGLTEASLRPGSKKPQIMARPRRALLVLGASSPLSFSTPSRELP